MHFPRCLRLTPSPVLLWVGCLFHLGVLVVCQIGLESVWLRLGCALMIAASLIKFVIDEWSKRGSVVHLDENGFFSCGKEVDVPAGSLIERVTDFRWVVWIKWQDSNEVGSVGRVNFLMLLADHFEPEGWRVLRVWLNHKAVMFNRNGIDADAS